VDCNYSMALSDNEEYIAKKVKENKVPKYHLRRRQVHGIADRMTYLSYDRDKYNQKKHVKNKKLKNGQVIEIDPHFYTMKNGGHEEDILYNKNFDNLNQN
jgi:hypothetical protein